MKILKVINVDKYYNSNSGPLHIIKNISFDIEENEFVAIMGPSGSGKTTLLNMISTIDNVTSGDILLDGERIVDLNEDELASFRGNKLGFIFQDYNLIDTLTVRENIEFSMAIKKENNYKYIEIVAKELGIFDILDKYPLEISGGEKQRAAISRSIVTKPAIVLADEPTGSLDSLSSNNVLKALKNLKDNHNGTVLMVTHDIFAASWTDRILFLKDGIIWNQLKKEDRTREEYLNKILEFMKVLGGDLNV